MELIIMCSRKLCIHFVRDYYDEKKNKNMILFVRNYTVVFIDK